uniref:N-acetyltransferase domain-containing protein n=1 Tax=Thermosporothrix sp. COM3 TaxID=2490863 RepID=A0A455SPE5_9CHLR|nr:hypothetical protein KTC_42610 [Thermosporothrix sp. COM3]
MEARIITDRQQWNDFVTSSVCCNITQSYEWGDYATQLDGVQETLRVGVVDNDGKLCAAMLILVSQAPIIKQTYFYAPRGPIIEDPHSPAMTVLLNFVKAEAHKRGAFMLKVEPSVADRNLKWSSALRRFGFHANPHYVHIRHEWVLDIQPDEKTLLSQMKEKWRYNIRLAGRKGVTVRPGTSDADFDAFFRLYQVTSERDRFHINSKEFYRNVLETFRSQDMGQLFIAEYEGKPIAAIIVLCFGRWSWYMYGASGNEHRERMPNHLLQWTGIQWAKQHGCWYYNFRGIPDILEEGQELWGVYQFKRGFGGYPIRFMDTHDLAYRPVVYQTYRALLEIKTKRDEMAYRKAAAARTVAHAEKAREKPGK